MKPIDRILAEVQHCRQGVTYSELCERFGYNPLNIAMAVATLESQGKVVTTAQRVYARSHKSDYAGETDG